jgi:formiminotetrahydrofolate cyclodeaminase
MVARLSLKKAESQKDQQSVTTLLAESDKLRASLLAQVDKDAQSFESLMKAYKLSKATEREREARSIEIQAKLQTATEVPLQSAEQAARTLSAARRLIDHANMNAISDLESAIGIAHAGFQGAVANVKINLSSIKDTEYTKQIGERIDVLQTQVQEDRDKAYSALALRTAT